MQAAGEVLGLFVDDSIPGDCPFVDVQQRAFAILDPQTFKDVSNYLRNVAFDQLSHEWDYLSKISMTIKRNLRHLFCELNFSGRVEEAPLANAITVLQELLGQDISLQKVDLALFPTALIPKSHKRYLYRNDDATDKAAKVLDLDRYEFLVYRLLRSALESGDMFVNHSHEFRRFEDDLISDERWKDKEALLAEIGLPILLAPIQDTFAEFRLGRQVRRGEPTHCRRH